MLKKKPRLPQVEQKFRESGYPGAERGAPRSGPVLTILDTVTQPVLAKPFDPTELRALINKFLQQPG